jgi:hypothetical protein
MTVLAAIRPDDWNWLLLGHLLGVAALFGSLLIVGVISALTRDLAAPQSYLVRRVVLLTVTFGSWPGFLLTIGLGHALQSKEDLKGTWVDVAAPLTEIVGFIGVGLLTYFATVAMRRARDGKDAPTAVSLSALIAPLLLVIFAGVLFLMTAKPS